MSDTIKLEEYYNRVSPSEEIYPQYCGMEQCLPAHRHSSQRREYLFHYVLSGRGAVFHNGKKRELSRGDGFLIHPNQNISYQADRKDPWKYVWVGFTGKRCPELLEDLGIHREIILLRGGKSSELERQFATLLETVRGRRPGFDLRAKGDLFHILSSLPSFFGRESLAQDRADRDYTEAVISFIKANFNRPITVQILADYAGLDRRYLTTLFREKTGRTLQGYLIRYRMDRAAELLKSTKLSIAEVGQSVGYQDYPSFARAFKRTRGCSAMELRR